MEDYAPLDEGREAHWEVVERILFLYAKLNPGQSYVQVIYMISSLIASVKHNYFVAWTQLGNEFICAKKIILCNIYRE